MSNIKEGIEEVFNPQKLHTDPFWQLEYGVPFDKVTYVVDSVYPEDWDDFSNPAYIGGCIKAMDRVEELVRTSASTAFVIKRPLADKLRREADEHEYIVFKADFPAGKNVK
ncbi:hypothetical protein HYW43_04490 [Candidatus Daviesbacteria bacterium]|nr:hypothetical protein [Candidatus Daviesbacteria bacterium]